VKEIAPEVVLAHVPEIVLAPVLAPIILVHAGALADPGVRHLGVQEHVLLICLIVRSVVAVTVVVVFILVHPFVI
jgi:hypothetical protein